MSRGRTTPCTLLPRTGLSGPALRSGSPFPVLRPQWVGLYSRVLLSNIREIV